MPGLDSDVVSIIVARTALVVSAYAAFMSGFSIRHGMRAAGWPRWSVRLATAMTWIVSLFVASRVLFPAPLTTDLERAIYRVILLSSFAILVFWVVGLDATRRAIDRRPSRRVRMFAEIQAVHDALASVRTADDRERFDGSLADLDRYLEPATFEYIQLTRSRLTSWLDGGPSAEERERRWSARLDEIAPSVRPASWWREDAWSRLGQGVRARILGAAPLLAGLSGVVLGRSVLSGPIWVAMPAAVLAAFLFTWRWTAAATPFIACTAVGLAAATLLRQPSLPVPAVATAGSFCAALLAWAAFEWRRARRRPDLRLLPAADAPDLRSPDVG